MSKVAQNATHEEITLEAKKDFFKKDKKAAEFLNSCCQRLEQGK